MIYSFNNEYVWKGCMSVKTAQKAVAEKNHLVVEKRRSQRKFNNLPYWTFWLEKCGRLLCRVFSIFELLDDKCCLVVQKNIILGMLKVFFLRDFQYRIMDVNFYIQIIIKVFSLIKYFLSNKNLTSPILTLDAN